MHPAGFEIIWPNKKVRAPDTALRVLEVERRYNTGWLECRRPSAARLRHASGVSELFLLLSGETVEHLLQGRLA